MPTCWPFDERSDPKTDKEINILNLDIDLLMMKRSFEETRKIAEEEDICSIKGTTFMSSLTDKNGNVLEIIPGQGHLYFERPEYQIMTNFSPFKMDSELHPWMGLDRYEKAEEMLKKKNDDFDVKDMFNILKEVSQTICPTVFSMVYDSNENTAYWCENRKWEKLAKKRL